jgi:hypothetical protein
MLSRHHREKRRTFWGANVDCNRGKARTADHIAAIGISLAGFRRVRSVANISICLRVPFSLGLLGRPSTPLRICDRLPGFRTKYPLDACFSLRAAALPRTGPVGAAKLSLYLAGRRKKIPHLTQTRNLRIQLSDNSFYCHSPENTRFRNISRYNQSGFLGFVPFCTHISASLP